MSLTARPTDHAVVAHLPDADATDAALADLADLDAVDPNSVLTGTGEDFAAALDGKDPEVGTLARLVSWIATLGQEQDALKDLAMQARNGRWAVVVNDVRDETAGEQVGDVLRRHGGEGITWFGDWQTEDLDVQR